MGSDYDSQTTRQEWGHAVFDPGVTNPDDVEIIGRPQQHTPEEILEDVAKLCDPGHARDLHEQRKRLDDVAKVSSHSPKKTLGMSTGETMRYAGSIPTEIWLADVALRPNLEDGERAKDLLKRFPCYRVGVM
jgi:hypothetical protein